MDHMCLQSPQARRRRATWSITGRLSTKKCNGHFSSPSHLRWRSPQRPIIDPPEFRKYRFSHCFPKHGDECGEQGDQKTRVHEPSDGDDLTRWVFLNRWNGGGFTWDSGLIESQEDRGQESHGLFVWVGLEF